MIHIHVFHFNQFNILTILFQNSSLVYYAFNLVTSNSLYTSLTSLRSFHCICSDRKHTSPSSSFLGPNCHVNECSFGHNNFDNISLSFSYSLCVGILLLSIVCPSPSWTTSSTITVSLLRASSVSVCPSLIAWSLSGQSVSLSLQSLYHSPSFHVALSLPMFNQICV